MYKSFAKLHVFFEKCKCFSIFIDYFDRIVVFCQLKFRVLSLDG